MGKDKLRRFSENLTFDNFIQPDFAQVFRTDHPLKGMWHEKVFGNNNPITLELGCGRGEYTVALARMYPERNFIGVDIKGARMWRGAKTAAEENIRNARFLRTRIEFIGSFFGPAEVDQIWITFPDPQLKKSRIRKRLTAPGFLEAYSRFLKPGGTVNLKTDSQHLHRYTRAVIDANGLHEVTACDDIYGTGMADDVLSIRTAYEARFLAEGQKITYVSFELGGSGSFVDPEFEEE